MSKQVEEKIMLTTEFEEMFPIVDIERVSLQDRFMQYEPKTNRGKRVKESIIKAKEIGMKNFRKAVMDPSFADDGETIIYCAGERPAVGKSLRWWDENARKFMPDKNSRLIDDLQKDVWLGIIIKELIDNGYEVEEAWNAVCIDSQKIGHYCNSEEAKGRFETTGSRKIGRWFDLGNTFKITKKYEGVGFAIYGATYNLISFEVPLSDVSIIDDSFKICGAGVGELVVDV